MTASILLIEKARSSIDWILQSLEKKGYEVSLAHDEQQAVQQANSETPDLIILNATSRKLDGPGLCRILHKGVAEIPIILILAKGQEGDDSMEAAVVLTPPFTFRKLLNRIKNILKSDEGETLQAGRLTLNLGTRRVNSGNKERRLNPKELELLKIFMRSPGRVLSRRFLMKKNLENRLRGRYQNPGRPYPLAAGEDRGKPEPADLFAHGARGGLSLRDTEGNRRRDGVNRFQNVVPEQPQCNQSDLLVQRARAIP